MKTLPVGRILIAFIIWGAATDLVLADCGELNLQHPSVRFKIIAQTLVYPWTVAFLPAGDMLVTERPGRLRLIRRGVLLNEPVHGLPTLVNLFDVAVHPDFVNNRQLYLAYLARDDTAVGLEVMRARLSKNHLVDKQVVFRATPKTNPTPLSGGRLLFVSGNELMITVGDRPDGLSNAQNPTNHFGTIVRITDSGLAPSTSSYGDVWLREIYTLGHRNVQGIALDQENGEIWITEHGPEGGDELNILRAGANYGWPIFHFGIRQSMPTKLEVTTKESFENPIRTWTPAIAPSGLAVYRGNRFPEWNGSIFVGSLLSCHVLRIRLSENRQVLAEERLLGELGERIRDVRVGPDESLYVLTDELSGKLISIEPYE